MSLAKLQVFASNTTFMTFSKHPFEKMFEKAIPKSRGDENHVLGEAEKLMGQGYAPREIYDVLKKLKQSLIIEAEEKIVAEALEEFSQYVDLDTED